MSEGIYEPAAPWITTEGMATGRITATISAAAGLPSQILISLVYDTSLLSRMNQVLTFSGSVKRDPAIERWMKAHGGELGLIARHWFEVMRECGDDVREVLHDGHPTACIANAGFGYVNAFKAHVNVGFFRGAEIADPEGLLEGTGRFMRHVKLRPNGDFNSTALRKLIDTAYVDMKRRVAPKNWMES